MAADHRTFTLPLLVLGALALLGGAAAAVRAAATGGAIAVPAAIAGAGLVLIVGGASLALALHGRPSGTGEFVLVTVPVGRRRKVVAGVAALALFLVAVAAIGSAGFGSLMTGGVDSELDPNAAPPEMPALDAPLSIEHGAGGIQGASTPPLAGVPSNSIQHGLAPAAGATSARIELVWTAGTGGAPTLNARLQQQVDGAWVNVASASGGSILTFDATELVDAPTRLVVALPAGTATTGQDYEFHASFFAADIPKDHSALAAGHEHGAKE